MTDLSDLERFMACIDKRNNLHIFTKGKFHEIGRIPIRPRDILHYQLSEENLQQVRSIQNYALYMEDRFLTATRLYSKNVDRRIFYSNRSNLYFVIAVDPETKKLMTYPCKCFTDLMLDEMPDGIEDFSAALAMDLAIISFHPSINCMPIIKKSSLRA